MTPRLNRSGRIADAKYRHRSTLHHFNLGSSRPSPAERLRERRKARAAAMRWNETMRWVEAKTLFDASMIISTRSHRDF